MNNSNRQFQSINNFLETYATALERYDTKQMAYLYATPCTLISDDKTTVFNEFSRLEGFFNQGAAFYKQFGIAKALHEVWSKREWTKRIVNLKVNWQYYDAVNKPVYSCDYHYVLRADKYNQWKIILSVSVNEKERMEEWQATRATQLQAQ